MRAMLVLVVAMGVLIVAGTATVAVTVLGRLGHKAGVAQVVLDEPTGTRIVGAAAWGQGLAVVLQGGGPDRIVMVKEAAGSVRLAR